MRIEVCPVGQDDMIHGHAIVESADFVEVNHLLNGYRRLRFAHIGKCAAISERFKRSPLQTKELTDADTQQAMPLGKRIPARLTFLAFDACFGDKQPVIRRRIEEFVRVEVIPMAESLSGARLSDEVEAG